MGVGSIFWAASVILAPPLTVGYASFCLRIYRGETGDTAGIFGNGFGLFWRNVGGMLFMDLFIFIWSLLFIVPGIIKAFAYSMTPYILADGKNVRATDAIKLSMCMTRGYKGKIFVMMLSFFWWGLLTALTGGILAIFYTGPYFSTSMAGLYEELKTNAISSGAIEEQELA